MILLKDRHEKSLYFVDTFRNHNNLDYKSMTTIRGIIELVICLLLIRLEYKKNKIRAPEAGVNKLFKYWHFRQDSVAYGKVGFTVSEKLRYEVTKY
jgi:hypothetical protein